MKRLTKEECLGRLHVGLRPKLDKGQRRDLALVHLTNLDTIARTGADEDVLWRWADSALLWSYVASTLEKRDFQRFREAGAAMRDQLDVVQQVLQRFVRTGRVGFSGVEYQRAKEASEWMDALAEVVDQPTASRAADAAEVMVEDMKRQHTVRRKAA